MFTIEDLAGIVSLAHKDTDGYIANLKGEDGEFTKQPSEIVEDLKASILQKFKKDKDGQLKRGQSSIKQEVLATALGLMEGLEIEDGATAKDIVTALYSAIDAKKVITKEVPGKAEITEELLAKDPIAQAYFKTQFHSKLKSKEEELEEAKSAYERKTLDLILGNRKARIKAQLLEELDAQKVILEVEGDTTITREKRINTFLQNPVFDPKNWKEDESNNLIPIGANGLRLQTDDLHDADMSDLVRMHNPFGFRVKDNTKGSPKTPTKGNPPKAGGAKVTFKDDADYYAQRAKLRNPSDRKNLSVAYAEWKESQTAN